MQYATCLAANCRAYAHEDNKLCFTHLMKKVQFATENTGPELPPTLPPKGNPIDPLKVQVGGAHYKGLAIQPIEYIHANNIPFAEGSVIKYVSRWRDKGGIADLRKAAHFIELLIALETKNQEKG
jgi:hypothetical protein